MTNVKLSEIVHILTNQLHCSQRSLATMLNIDKNTLSNNADKILEDLTPKTRFKVTYLFVLINTYLPAHDSDAIHQILNTHVYKNYTGETDSVLSSIQQLKHDLNTLESMVLTAKDEFENKVRDQMSVSVKHVTEYLLQA
ncbi:MAG: hypothetical protein ACC657_18870, partial [Thiohalomonadales bacterium]